MENKDSKSDLKDLSWLANGLDRLFMWSKIELGISHHQFLTKQDFEEISFLHTKLISKIVILQCFSWRYGLNIRDGGPYPADLVVNELEGSFAFIISIRRNQIFVGYFS